MKKVIIYGAGAYAKLLYCEASRSGIIDIAGFVVDDDYFKEDRLFDLSIIPFSEVERTYPQEEYDMLVLCGYTRMSNRKLMYDKAKEKGYRLANYISPKAFLENDIKMGDNNIIMSGTILGFDGCMGNDNVIRQDVYLGHEFKIYNHSIISTGCKLGGRSTIEDLVFMGIGVSAKGYITYGEGSLIGVGSVVVKDVEPYSKCYGNPAKVAGYHRETGVVLIED